VWALHQQGTLYQACGPMCAARCPWVGGSRAQQR
jgi:hypothetical protein